MAGVEYWNDQAAAAYRSGVRGRVEHMEAAGKLVGILSEITMVAGAMIGVVRNTVRDLIAEVVGAAISKALWALAVVTIPKIAAEIAIMVGKYSAMIASLLKRLSLAIKELAGKTKYGTDLLERIGAFFARQGDDLYLGADSLQTARTGATRVFGDTGCNGFPDAYRHVADGHVGAHGTTRQSVMDILKTAPRDNGLQNVGAYGNWATDDDAPEHPGPIELPL